MRIAAFLAVLIMASAAEQTPADYRRAIEQWRAQREAKLKADDGWLTVVGLTWLKEGESRVGSDPGSEVRLPPSAPKRVGMITVKAGRAHFKAEKGVKVLMNGAPVTEADLKPDVDAHYDRIAVGRVKFHIIKRENKLGVRIKDNDSSARREFTGLRWYPVDPSWRIEANYVPWDKPRTLTFDTEAGVREQDESPGYVTFRSNGQEYRLAPVIDGGELWFVMRDATSGKTTYGASRFLYAPLPEGGLKQPGTVQLDFNKAENPPCVFTAYATCPLPPPQNRLTLAVTAGEMMYKAGASHP